MSAFSTHRHRPRRRRHDGAFILLEVIVALAILGLAIASVMRGFTIGLSTLQRNRVTCVGMTLAQRLLEEYEVELPPLGKEEGHFGEAFPHYGWERDIERQEVKYDGTRMNVAGNEMADMYLIHLTVYYYRDADDNKPIIAADVDTAFTQFEHFSFATRLRSGLYPHK